MKKIIIAFVTFVLVFGLFTLQSCTKDESPTPTVHFTAATPVATSPAVSEDGTVFVTGTSVELAWAAENKGKPAIWDLYFGTSKSPALLQAGLTTTKRTVTVEDGLTYYWRVICTDENGIKTTSELFKFTAIDGSNPKFTVNLNCETDVLSAIGVDLKADDVVDLRFLIINTSDGAIVETVDGGYANEVFRGFANLPDGEYQLSVDIYSTIDAGDLNSPINLSLALKFGQLGVIDTTFYYPNVMTNENACDTYRTNLATVTKVGSEYTIKREVSYITPAITWNGEDATYPSEVQTTLNCDGLTTMTGLNFGWMLDWWGEVIVAGGTLVYTEDGTTLNIPLQPYCQTTYNGALQTLYYIKGTGTIDNSGAYPVYTIHYDIRQSGVWIGHYCYLNYGWEQDGFDAILTTAPDAKNANKTGMRPAKPVR